MKKEIEKEKLKVGFKTQDMFYSGKGKVTEKIMEISAKDPAFLFRRKTFEKIKKHLKGKSLSMHSQTKSIFEEKNKCLRDLEIRILESEILACEFLGCDELVVHLKQDKLKKKEIETFSDVLNFAKKHGVEILYEINSKLVAENFLFNLSKFRSLNVVLDFGHLNAAIVNEDIGMDIDKFIGAVRDRVVYIHAHNNNGEDSHIGLDAGSLDWKGVLDKLDLGKVRKIIIELHNFSYYKSTRKLLMNYLRRGAK